MSDITVLKFGGSSLDRPERVAQAATLVTHSAARGRVAVVVSAAGSITDWLLDAAEHAVVGNSEARAHTLAAIERQLRESFELDAAGEAELRAAMQPLDDLLDGVAQVSELSASVRDRVMAFGELWTTDLFAHALERRGLRSEAIDARRWVVTDERHGDARVLWEPTQAALLSLDESTDDAQRVTVHAGFIGRSAQGRTTTIGRNGADYTATLLARGLGAREVILWTDVSGVLTADPVLVEDARTVPALSYGEALELTGLGLTLLHPRTMRPLLDAAIPLRIRNLLRPDDPGTVIDAHGSREEGRPTCVTSIGDLALIDVEATLRSDGGELGPRAFAAVARLGVDVLFETQAPHGLGAAFAVRREHAAQLVESLNQSLAHDIARGRVHPARVTEPVAIVTLVGENTARTANVSGRFFGALGSFGIDVKASAQRASSRTISAIVDESGLATAVRAVHAAFALSAEEVNVFLLGKGVVGGEFLRQLAAGRGVLLREHDLALRLVGVADRRHVSFDADGLDPETALTTLAEAPMRTPASLAEALRVFGSLPVPVLVDCTAEGDMHPLYEQAFAHGVNVVAANKKPLTLARAAHEALFAAARRAHRAYRYETTVGASLPVIDTLKNLRRTGDRVRKVEGSFSGTLGYLANQMGRGVSLLDAVRDAKARGYTEPHPRDDLSGADAARKALILARELGMQLDFEDVSVEPFVPAELLAHDELDAFYAALADYSPTMAARIAEHAARGETLRYLAMLDPEAGTARVAATFVPADHPATHLRGTEAFVAFYTDRYEEFPLVVQGAGAGGAVTAAGVLADVLALSQTLRGR